MLKQKQIQQYYKTSKDLYFVVSIIKRVEVKTLQYILFFLENVPF